MKTLLSLFAFLLCCSVAHAGDARKNLIGKWTGSNGEGATKMVYTLEFKENGDFFRVTTMGGREFQPIAGGKWLLANSVTGIRAVVADADKLIVTYKETEPKMVDKTEAWIFVIKKQDPIFDGKETLTLKSVGGGLGAMNEYYVRVP